MKLRVALYPAFVAAAATAFAQPQPHQFGGGFSELKPPQQRLAADWIHRFNAVMKQSGSNEEVYDNLPVSIRTTYGAVSHALMTTKLTRNDQPAGTALDLVAQLDMVNGKIHGVGGDHQYRLYVVLKPDALKTLQETEPFKRGMDNTVYHKEYPLNYRQQGGVPSIQFSITRDGKRADIDVDYRSSKFPGGLFNGHLTSSNSDVTAGNNHERHVNRWDGLPNWWRSLFGLPLTPPPNSVASTIPATPSVKAKEKAATAAHDFFESWLVKQTPAQSVAYFADQAYACLELQTGKPIDRGMAPFQVLQQMKQVNTKFGRAADLATVIEPVTIQMEGLKLVEQPYANEFALYEVPESIAFQHNCYYQLHPEEAAKEKPTDKYGRFYASILRLKGGGTKGKPFAVVWAKEGDYWKIVSVEGEPDAQRIRPTVPAPAEPIPPKQFVAGDSSFIRANGEFLRQWLVKRNFDSATTYFSPECDECLRMEAEEPITDPHSALRNALKRVSDTLRRSGSLKEVVKAADPQHSDLRFIHHPHEENFTLMSVPNSIGEFLECKSQAASKPFVPAAPVYGTYYASGFTLNIRGEPPVLYLIWRKTSSDWKIVAFEVQEP